MDGITGKIGRRGTVARGYRLPPATLAGTGCKVASPAAWRSARSGVPSSPGADRPARRSPPAQSVYVNLAPECTARRAPNHDRPISLCDDRPPLAIAESLTPGRHVDRRFALLPGPCYIALLWLARPVADWVQMFPLVAAGLAVVPTSHAGFSTDSATLRGAETALSISGTRLVAPCCLFRRSRP